MDRVERLEGLYRAFNAREMDVLLGQMTPDVDWPNAWEGGRVHGREGVRDYWTRQWAEIDPTVEPEGYTTRLDETVAVRVHTVARALDGTVLGEADVAHVYAFRGDLIARMDVEEPTG